MSTLRKTLLNDQSGAALVIALLMMIVLSLVGLASMFTSAFEIKLSGNKRGATDAFYAAESGIQVVVANIDNFSLPDKYVDDRYDPFTDPNNPNPTQASVTILNMPDMKGAPRGMGFSATHFGFEHFMITSVGRDQTNSSPIRSTCELEEKVIRLVPTLQGGY